MKAMPAAIAAAAAIWLAPSAQAAVVYAFQTSAGLSTYLSAGFVTADTGPQAFGRCVNADGFACQSVAFDTAPSGFGARDVATVRAVDTGNGVPSTFDLPFAPGTLATEGIHVINAANAMVVLEIPDYAPGSVLYLIETPFGRSGVITPGFAELGTRDLQPDSCVTNPPYDCGRMGFDFGAVNGVAQDYVYQGLTGNGRRFDFGYAFLQGTLRHPGLYLDVAGSSYLAVIPLPIPQAAAVPEAGTWALLIAGFGLTGAALRRRRLRPRSPRVGVSRPRPARGAR